MLLQIIQRDKRIKGPKWLEIMEASKTSTCLLFSLIDTNNFGLKIDISWLKNNVTSRYGNIYFVTFCAVTRKYEI